MTTQNMDDHIASARKQAQERMALAQEQFGLGQHARYEVDLPTATICFYDGNNVEKVRADIQVGGSWSPASQSWLWGWENQSVPEVARSRMGAVRDFGYAQNAPALFAAFTPCDEGAAWSVASIAAKVLNAECLYRAPGATNQTFLLLFSLRHIA